MNASDPLAGVSPQTSQEANSAKGAEVRGEPRKRPEIRNVEDFWCWLNTWGDERSHVYELRCERDAYRQCIRDAMKALESAGVGFEQVRDEAWARWTGSDKWRKA